MPYESTQRLNPIKQKMESVLETSKDVGSLLSPYLAHSTERCTVGTDTIPEYFVSIYPGQFPPRSFITAVSNRDKSDILKKNAYYNQFYTDKTKLFEKLNSYQKNNVTMKKEVWNRLPGLPARKSIEADSLAVMTHNESLIFPKENDQFSFDAVHGFYYIVKSRDEISPELSSPILSFLANVDLWCREQSATSQNKKVRVYFYIEAEELMEHKYNYKCKNNRL